MQAKLSGIVTQFKGNGRQLGYPTANLAVITDIADGVYFGFADMAGYANHPAVIFVGTPTTVGDSDRRVEAHLLDIPDKDYYGEPLGLDIRQKHRDNQTFKSLDDLKQAMAEDGKTARQWFSSGKNQA